MEKLGHVQMQEVTTSEAECRVLPGRPRACDRGRLSWLYSRQAKSVWRPSSREMSSLLKVSPGMSWRFLSQKMAQKEPLKWMPSTHANATKRSAKLPLLPIQRCAQSAFLRTHGSVLIACSHHARTSSAPPEVSHDPTTMKNAIHTPCLSIP